jgi:hypothetical protein
MTPKNQHGRQRAQEIQMNVSPDRRFRRFNGRWLWTGATARGFGWRCGRFIHCAAETLRARRFAGQFPIGLPSANSTMYFIAQLPMPVRFAPGGLLKIQSCPF